MVGCLSAIILRSLAPSDFLNAISFGSVLTANLLYFFIALAYVDFVFSLNMNFEDRAKDNQKFHILKAIATSFFFIGSIVLLYFSFYRNPVWVSWVNLSSLAIFLIIAILRLLP